MTPGAPPPSPAPDDGRLLGIDELATSTGLTVRTTRYYASLGLLPAPIRRGRMAYYGAEHLGRLQLVRALQDHGFTLAAIERHLASVPMTATAEEMAVQRALLTAWHPGPVETMTRVGLDELAGRSLSERDVDDLVRIGVVTPRTDTGYDVLPVAREAVEALDLGTPLEAIIEANAAVRRRMGELADELSRILREGVIPHLPEASDDAEHLGRVVASLRSLTLDAIVLGFQRAAHHVALHSWTSGAPDQHGDTPTEQPSTS